MNKFIIYIAFIILPAFVSGQNEILNTLRKYKNDAGIVSLKFDGQGFIDKANKNNKNLKSKIDFIDVYYMEDGVKLSEKDQAKITASLEKDNFELIIRVKEKDHNINCYVKESKNALSHAFAKVDMEGKNFYVFIAGDFYLEELSQLEMNFEGSEILKAFGG